MPPIADAILMIRAEDFFDPLWSKSATHYIMSKHPPQILTTSAQPPPSLPVSQATKRASDGDNEDTVLSDKDLIKRSKKRRLHQEDQQKLDLDHGVNVDIAKMDTHLLANYVAQHTKRFHVEFSSVELEDLHLPGKLAC